MIKVYRLINSTESPIASLSIDPGINTAGFTLIVPREKRVEICSMTAKRTVSTSSFPAMYSTGTEAVNEMLSHVPTGIDPSRISVIMEYTHHIGIFSPELFLTYALLVERLLMEKGVGRVCLIPPLIPKYFMQKKGSLAKSETVKFVKENLGMVLTKKRINSHMADSLLFSVFMHYKFYQKVYNVNLRTPEFEFVDMERPSPDTIGGEYAES